MSGTPFPTQQPNFVLSICVPILCRYQPRSLGSLSKQDRENPGNEVVQVWDSALRTLSYEDDSIVLKQKQNTMKDDVYPETGKLITYANYRHLITRVSVIKRLSRHKRAHSLLIDIRICPLGMNFNCSLVILHWRWFVL